jgi:hypothetical protein
VEGVEDGEHVGGEVLPGGLLVLRRLVREPASSCSGGWSESPYPRQSGATARYPAAATARIWWRHEYHISGKPCRNTTVPSLSANERRYREQIIVTNSCL